MSFSFVNKVNISEAQFDKEVTANEGIEAIAKSVGHLSKTIVAGSQTLSEDEARHGVITLGGALGAGATVIQPVNITKRTLFRNQTTGGQVVQVQFSGGTLFTVPTGGALHLLSSTIGIALQADTTPNPLATAGSAGTAETLSRSDHKHARDVVPLLFNTATATWTAQPAGLTEFLGLNDRRRKYDLTQFTQVRLMANVEAAGVAGSKLRAEYSTDQSTWNDIENGAGTGPEIAIDATGTIVSAYVTIPVGAQADVFLRISGISGNGAASPQLGLIELQCK